MYRSNSYYSPSAYMSRFGVSRRRRSPFADTVKRGFLFYAFSTLAVAVLMGFNITGSNIAEMMNLETWLFFLASCVSHAATLCLIPYIIYVLLAACRLPRVANATHIALTVVLMALIYLDSQVLDIYRFHINGFVLGMVFGEGASEIFTFSPWVYVHEALRLVGVVTVVYALAAAAGKVWQWRRRAYAWPVAITFVGCTLFAHLWHIYAAAAQHAAVMKSATLLPYYFPTTANGLMFHMGLISDSSYRNTASRQGGDVSYPLRPLKAVRPKSLPNIVVIMVDSWNRRALTPECMPFTYRFAMGNRWYTNHVSASNDTRSGVFGFFFGLSCYYWETFEPQHIQPLLIDRMLRLGYQCQAYPSATLLEPPIVKVVFGDIPHLNVRTPGVHAYDRDSTLAARFISDMGKWKTGRAPHFSFLFFDQPNSFEIRPEDNRTFTPAWDYADYTRLSPTMDATPFWNLYRNTCHQVDRQIARVVRAMYSEGQLDNTVLIITGDHSQEFNENHRGYWGHNSNFSLHQIGVPLVCYFPGQPAGRFTHRTTHYDIVPTLMRRYLGVSNAPGDYSMGHDLDDRQPRSWHVVGSNLNYAFIVGGDTILEKTATNALDVYTPQMKPVSGYRLPAQEFDRAVKNLNKFFK